VGYGFKMVGIAAKPVSAGVVDLLALMDISELENIHHSMDRSR